MKDCDSIRQLLPLNAGGDLEATDSRRIELHLEICPACRAEESRFAALIALAGTSWETGDRLPAPVRERIAVEAAENARAILSAFRVPLFATVTPGGGPIVALAAVLIALVALPLVLRNGGTAFREEPGLEIEVVAEGGTVKLAWRDGERDSYTVFKSDNPRDFNRGEVYPVRGNVWIDTDPDSSTVVFYRIK